MAIKYFKPDILIDISCDHCGASQAQTLAQLYSDAVLPCYACGREHVLDRANLRRSVDETEALLDKLPDWPQRF